MIDQLIVGNKSSFDDYEASLKTRIINKPAKKSIRETVPFSNVVYDFTAINGEIYWEERDLEYVLEIMAETPELLEQKKAALASWLMNISDEVLNDPFIKDYHFKVTFDDIKEEDEEDVEKTTITVMFKAYPYMIANEPKILASSLAANVEKEMVIVNESSHRITPTIEADFPVTITMDGVSYGIAAGTTTDDSFKLAAGNNALKLKSANAGEVKFTFIEEIF